MCSVHLRLVCAIVWYIDCFFFFFQAEDGIRDLTVTGVRRVLFRSLFADGFGDRGGVDPIGLGVNLPDRKSTRLNSSHSQISYAVFCLKKKKKKKEQKYYQRAHIHHTIKHIM